MRTRNALAALVVVLVAVGGVSGCKPDGSGGSASVTQATQTAPPASVSAVASAAAPATPSALPAPSAGVTTVAVTVDGKGFTPSSASFKKGEHAQLVFTRTSDETCAKEVVFPELNVKKPLPLNQAVAIDVPTADARTLTFQCGMGMFKSKVTIQ